MYQVDQFESLLDAVQAADHLLAHGVVARVVGDRRAIDFNLRGLATYDVVVLDRAKAEQARRILAEMPPAGEIDWDTELIPDLSRLDITFAPTCPSCGTHLPLRADLDTCPGCAATVDVAGLIIEQHGPEVLAVCYDDRMPDFDERQLLSARLHCTRCNYSLEGLAIEGHCPECSAVYDKREIVRSIIR